MTSCQAKSYSSPPTAWATAEWNPPQLSRCRLSLNVLAFGCIVSRPDPFGKLSVCHSAVPAVPAVGQKEQRRASCNDGMPEAAGVLSGLLCRICLRGERGIASAGDCPGVVLQSACTQPEQGSSPLRVVCFFASTAPSAAVSLCECDVPVLRHEPHQGPSEWRRASTIYLLNLHSNKLHFHNVGWCVSRTKRIINHNHFLF